MGFLYGDLSPSPLTINYLGYLRRVLAMAVEVLLLEDQLAGLARRRRSRQVRSRELASRLEALHATVHEAVGGVARSPDDDPVIHCANDIEAAVAAVVARAVAGVKAQDDAAEAELAARERTGRAGCREAIEAFLRGFDFPDASVEVRVERAGAGYAATRRATTPYHVAWELELDPAESPFAAEVRAGSLVRSRIADLKLDKLVVVAARCDPRELALGLRIGGDAGADGLELTVARAGGEVRASRIRRGGASEPMAASGDDARGLASLGAAVIAALDGMAARRTRLRELTLDRVPLDEHPRPSILIDRVLDAMAPQVRTIVERSRVPGELSLRLDLGDGRREEIFLAHAELGELVGQVPVARRRHFDVLGIAALAGARPATAEVDADQIIDAPELSEPSISIHHEPISDP